MGNSECFSCANSIWELTDSYNTVISVDGFTLTNQMKGLGPVRGSVITSEVYQSYCNVANDRWVDRSWYGHADSPVTIARDLPVASWPAVEITMVRAETDTPLINHSCDALDWENAESFDNLPSAALRIAGALSANRTVVIENLVSREAYDPWFYVTVTSARARMASEVNLQISSTDPLLAEAVESLPAPSFAFIGHTVRTEITLARGHLSGTT